MIPPLSPEAERSYRERVVTAIWTAIYEASRSPEHPESVHVRTVAVVDELLAFIAFFAASSPECRTNKGRRLVAQKLAKELHRKIGQTQGMMARFDGRSFATTQ